MQRGASQCSKVMRWPHFTLCAAFKHEDVTLQCERSKARLDAGSAWKDDVHVTLRRRGVFFSKHRCRTKVAKAYLDVSGSRPLNFSWDLQTFAQRLEKKINK